MNKPFTKEAEAFAAEMVELIKVHEDGDEPDERYKSFTKEFSRKIISETAFHTTLDNYRDITAALRLISKIKSFNGSEFEGMVDSYLNSAILHIMKPVPSLSALIEGGADEKSEIMINGTKITIDEAILIFENINAISASIANSIFYKDECQTEDIATANLGYNPIQKPREI
ncbi:hypothetical protein JE006_23125 [Pseudomonas aeruginosa]|nr:hypothetical protein [Pseudomonas aeruginosa]